MWRSTASCFLNCRLLWAFTVRMKRRLRSAVATTRLCGLTSLGWGGGAGWCRVGGGAGWCRVGGCRVVQGKGGGGFNDNHQAVRLDQPVGLGCRVG